MTKPIVWTIAGSDSSGGAGIQADLRAFHALDTHGCSIITALTAQNSLEVRAIEVTSINMLSAQFEALMADYPPKAIKLGMLGDVTVMETLLPYLQNYSGKIICDPVMVATSGARLMTPDAHDFFVTHILPLADLLTPNLLEAEALLNREIKNVEMMPKAAADLLALGAKSILIKGGHGDSEYSHDYWSDAKTAFWLSGPRYAHSHTHGSGCTLSAAITAAVANDYSMTEAFVIAKAYINQAIREACGYGQGPGPVAQGAWPVSAIDFPWLSYRDLPSAQQTAFPSCNNIGFYPVVDSSNWVKKLIDWKVPTVQLRIKDMNANDHEQEIKRCCDLARDSQTQLFINDDWQNAIKYGAFGVHLGQEDLESADLDVIRNAGLRLGVSTHNVVEAARAHALQPSYVACGPIYPTQSKAMAHPAVGCNTLKLWQQLLPYPIVAIGGINEKTVDSILAEKPAGIALIGALQQADDAEAFTREWIQQSLG